MTEYEKGIIAFNQKKFKDALAHFKCSENSDISEDEQVSLYNYLIRIYEITNNLTDKQDTELEYLSKLNEIQNYKILSSKSIAVYNSLKSKNNIEEYNSNIIKILNLIILSNHEQGEIGVVRKYFLILADRYLQQKNFVEGLKLIEKVKNYFLLTEAALKRYIDFILLENSPVNFDIHIKNIYKSIHKYHFDAKKIIEEKITNNLGKKTALYRSYYYSKIQLEYFLDQLGYSTDNTILRKKYIEVAYTSIAQWPDKTEFFINLFKYGYLTKSKYICTTTKNILTNSNSNSISRGDQKEISKITALFDEIDNFENDEINLDHIDEFDYATDLFTTTSSDLEDVGEQQRISRAVEFLMMAGETQKANELFKNQNSDNVDKSIALEPRLNISEVKSVEQNILDKLDYFQKRFGEKNQEADTLYREEALCHAIKIEQEKYVTVDYMDFAIGLKTMGMYKAARLILDIAADKKMIPQEIRERLSYDFLYVELLRDMGEYGTAISIIDNLLKTEPLNKDEQLCFHYLIAETYRENNEYERALPHYLLASDIDEDYRMVKMRIREFE